MKSRTSFFNVTVLKKDITRFAPVWGLYSVLMLLAVLLFWQDAEIPARFARNAPEIMLSMGVVNLFYAGLSAVVLFGDLFKSRMCNALHAMPMRREGWFLTHTVAGLLFCIVPNLVGALVAGLILQQYCYAAFLWLAVTVLQYLFFFSVGVFACMCAGNYLGATAVYGIINFLAVLVTWLVMTFIEPVLHGIRMDVLQYFKLSPVVAFSMFNYLDIEYYSAQEIAKLTAFYPEQWGYLGVAAGVGILFLGAAVLLYRKRKLESAGDLIAVKPVQPVFLVTYSLCAGALFYLVAGITGGGLGYLYLLVGLAVGWFTGKMLLERKVRVFNGKNLLWFGVLVLGLVACIVTARLDPVGVTRYVPEAEQVQSIQISPYDDEYYWEREGYPLTEPKDIETIIGLHQDLVDTGYHTGAMNLYLEYTMKNGAKVSRHYQLDPSSEAGRLLKGYYSSVKWVFGTEDVEDLLRKATLLEVHSHYEWIPSVMVDSQIGMEGDFTEKWGEEGKALTIFASVGTFDKNDVVKGLIEAMKQDCIDGKMAQNWEYHYNDETAASVIIDCIGTAYTLDFRIYSSCENTITYLKSLSEK